MTGIIDYGSGNVRAISNLLKLIDVDHILSSDVKELEKVDRFILAGVGHFDVTSRLLNELQIVDFLKAQTEDEGKALLGICVGMHILADSSAEGDESGLGFISGRIESLSDYDLSVLPHMGWNSIEFPDCDLLSGIDREMGFYFLHNYFFKPTVEEEIGATFEYEEKAFPCVVSRGNVHGVQFHPEKSHDNGVQLFKNFSKL